MVYQDNSLIIGGLVQDEVALKKPCEPASIEEGLSLIEDLKKDLHHYDGIGLAANQIGSNKRVCVIKAPRKTEEGKTYYVQRGFINPTIKSKKTPILFGDEGCLSFPGRIIETVRYREITVHDDLNGETHLTDIDAVIAFHEIDHLDGMTMFERRPKDIGPNGSCPCDSGRKFKKCCMLQCKPVKMKDLVPG